MPPTTTNIKFFNVLWFALTNLQINIQPQNLNVLRSHKKYLPVYFLLMDCCSVNCPFWEMFWNGTHCIVSQINWRRVVWIIVGVINTETISPSINRKLPNQLFNDRISSVGVAAKILETNEGSDCQQVLQLTIHEFVFIFRFSGYSTRSRTALERISCTWNGRARGRRTNLFYS